MISPIFSFDVFDTVLARTVLDPKDVFHLVAQQLSLKLPELNSRFISSFWGARVWAEFVARGRSSQEDISIDEIYRTLQEIFNLSESQTKQIFKIEIDVERSVLVPVNGASELISEIRHEGADLVFISDMYLPTSFIREVLEMHGLFLPGDKVYVSGDLGVTKGSGRLFQYVLNDLGTSSSSLVHFGDHPKSDNLVPSRHGIKLLQGRSHFSLTPSPLEPFRIKGKYALQILNALWQVKGFIRV